MRTDFCSIGRVKKGVSSYDCDRCVSGEEGRNESAGEVAGRGENEDVEMDLGCYKRWTE